MVKRVYTTLISSFICMFYLFMNFMHLWDYSRKGERGGGGGGGRSNIRDGLRNSSASQKIIKKTKEAFTISGVGLNSRLRDSQVCFVHEIGKEQWKKKIIGWWVCVPYIEKTRLSWIILQMHEAHENIKHVNKTRNQFGVTVLYRILIALICMHRTQTDFLIWTELLFSHFMCMHLMEKIMWLWRTLATHSGKSTTILVHSTMYQKAPFCSPEMVQWKLVL